MATSRKVIRITETKAALESLVKSESPASLREWVKLSKEELEYKLRYSKEETQTYQGALRLLDDLEVILRR